MRIGPFDTDSRVLVVAEIGNNHEGDFARAQELVRRAARCGAGAVKLQMFRTEHFARPSDEARFRRLKSFELAPERFRDLAALARSLGLLFVCTPLDLGSAGSLEPFVDAYKIASGDNTFYPLIDRVARSGKPMIVSTGLADAETLDPALTRIRRARPGGALRDSVALLHCISAYPVPPEQASLGAIRDLAARHPDVTVGYSDHTLGVEAAVLAVALGARILEKHFTLDKNQSDFRDHQISADPPELEELVRRVRAATEMIGSGRKSVQPCEREGVVAYRRSIVAGRDLPEGHRLGETDLLWLRPGDGLPPGEEHRLVGRRLRRAVRLGDPLRPEDVE